MAEFDFADAVEDRGPEIAENGEGLARQHGFVEHFPNDGELYERAGAAFTSYEPVGQADQLEETLLPSFHADFDVDPSIGLGFEEIRGDAVGFAAGFFGAARDRFHHAGVSAAAHRETTPRQRATEGECVGVVRIAFFWARTAKHGDDFF